MLVGSDEAEATFESGALFRARAGHRRIRFPRRNTDRTTVTKTKDEGQHSNRLDVGTWQNKLAHVLIDSKEAEHHCAEHHDPLCQYVCARPIVGAWNACPSA